MQQNNSLKIAYVVKRYPRYSETFIVNEILAHEKSGLDIDICSIKTSNDTHFQNIISDIKANVYYLNNNNRIKADDLLELQYKLDSMFPGFLKDINAFKLYDSEELYSGMKLAEHIHKNGNNHIHAHFATSASAVARIASYITAVPYTLTAHAKDIYHEDNDYEDLDQKLGDSQSVITVSNYNKEYLTRTFPNYSDKIYRVYNGLNLKQFKYKSPTNRKPVLLAIGRLVEKKGFSDLISACSMLSKNEVEYECQIVGEGDLKEQLIEQINSNNLQSKIKLIGPLPQNKIKRLIQNASIFVAPCIVGKDGNRDGLPTVLLESMALGTPCISTNVTGIPEVIENKKTGLIVPQNRADLLASAIIKFLEDKDLRVQVSLRARKLIEKNFDIVKNTITVRDIFYKTIDSSINNIKKVVNSKQ